MGHSTPSMMKRKNLLEALRAQAGERLEHAAVAGNLGVADHWGFLMLVVPTQSSTGGSITDRVYSLTFFGVTLRI